jgi:hypothetical protein
VGTIIHAQQRAHEARVQRSDRFERAEPCARYGDRTAQGRSQRQAAKVLDVPRRTLQAWQAYQETLDESPAVVRRPRRRKRRASGGPSASTTPMTCLPSAVRAAPQSEQRAWRRAWNRRAKSPAASLDSASRSPSACAPSATSTIVSTWSAL